MSALHDASGCTLLIVHVCEQNLSCSAATHWQKGAVASDAPNASSALSVVSVSSTLTASRAPKSLYPTAQTCALYCDASIKRGTCGVACCHLRVSNAGRLPHLQGLEDIKGQCVVPRPDTGVDESSVGMDIGGDAPPPHVCHQGQSLAQLLPLATQAYHCNAYQSDSTTCCLHMAC